MFLKDTDGDDKADVRERVLHGPRLGRHAPHRPTASCSTPAARSTSRKARSTTRRSRRPMGRRSAAPTRGVFRYEPRTQKFEVYVTFGFANPHGHVFDRWGQDIVVDGTGAVPYHGTLFSGQVDYPEQARPARRTVYQQRTRPCPGIEILSSRHFPESMQGNLLVANVIGFQGILQLQDRGQRTPSLAGTEVEPILSSTRPELPPLRRRGRAGRRDLLPRLAEPDHRPHAAQPPRPQPRPVTAGSTGSPTRAGRC